MNVGELIEKAKNQFPLSIYIRVCADECSDDDYTELEKACYVSCAFAYMDGSAELCIRYKGDEKKAKTEYFVVKVTR